MQHELALTQIKEKDGSQAHQCARLRVTQGEMDVMTLENGEQNRVCHLLSAMPGDTVSLDWLAGAHREQLLLCDALEEIADSLPASVNRQKCIYAAMVLGPLIHGLHRYEEEVLFPHLTARTKGNALLAETLKRLKFEHCEDECFAEELVDTLLKLGSGTPDVNIEAAGYMLRGFFETIRRHIAFERDHLLRGLHDA